MSRRKSKKVQAADLAMPVRNPVAANPLLGKSSVHGKSRKSDRRASKVSLRKMPLERITCSANSADQVVGSSGILPSVVIGVTHAIAA